MLKVQSPEQVDAELAPARCKRSDSACRSRKRAGWVSQAAQALRMAFGLFAGLILFVAGSRNCKRAGNDGARGA